MLRSHGLTHYQEINTTMNGVLEGPAMTDPQVGNLKVVTGEHWTGSPNKSIDQIGKNCLKNARKLCFQLLRTIFEHFSDGFSTFFGHFVDIPFFWAVQRFAHHNLKWIADKLSTSLHLGHQHPALKGTHARLRRPFSCNRVRSQESMQS